MNQLDNSEDQPARLLKNARKIGGFLLLGPLLLPGISCRKAAPAPAETAAMHPAAEAVAQAEQLFAGRQDLVKVRQAVVVLRLAQAEDQGNYELAWRLAKFNYYLGDHSPDTAERDKAFHDGIEAGKLAVKLADSKPEGHFWLGANYGGQAKTSMLAGLSEFDDIKHEMQAVLKLDEGYQDASAYLALGQLYLEAPGFMGGDIQQSIQYLEKGLKLGPHNALLRSELAAAYVEAHRNEDARKQIDALLAMKPAAGYEPEYNEAVAEVKKLQENIK
ncbi:MAG TPA: TRAP transporter TatT component family protein [Pyrinomonadaceae bacterium]|nr:TRAP transporter TatT component family protein [Pyrinomonadaceae bacterium]